MRVAIIPARGGSKRIPRKNIRIFHGKPMLVRAISTAMAAEMFDRIVVSTDDPEIAHLSKLHGAEVIYPRPFELSDDHASTIDVLKHSLGILQRECPEISSLCCVYPCTPFLDKTWIRDAYFLLADHVDYVVSSRPIDPRIWRSYQISDKGYIDMLFSPLASRRSQDLEQLYCDAGQFYWCKPAAILNGKPLLGPDSIPFVIRDGEVVDIDTEVDWKKAESLYSRTALVGEVGQGCE